MTFDAATEAELICHAQRGVSAAFVDLSRAHAERLYRSAWALCRDRQLAEDLAQETLLEAWQSLRRFDGRCRFATWLYGILRHRTLKALSRQARSCQPRAELDPDSVRSPLSSDPARAAPDQEDAARIRRAVDTLPEEHRVVIELRFFAAASLDEIAQVLNIPLGTVKSRLHHGLEKLRQQKLALNLFSLCGSLPRGHDD